MSGKRTLIIVPTYNERENVPALVQQILSVEAESDVLIIDDNSPDSTADCAEQLFESDRRFSILRRDGPRGLGRSYADGYRYALARGYVRLVQMDADFSHDPKSLPDLINASGTADVVVGSRYCEGGRVGNWSLRRRFLSRFANRYVSIITGMRVRDATSGFRCFSRRALKIIVRDPVNAEGYAFLVETLYRVDEAGLTIVEVPITFVDRREGKSKISRKVILESVIIPWRLQFSRRANRNSNT
jgi:dolichol-phosphate mannosyltransferase